MFLQFYYWSAAWLLVVWLISNRRLFDEFEFFITVIIAVIPVINTVGALVETAMLVFDELELYHERKKRNERK